MENEKKEQKNKELLTLNQEMSEQEKAFVQEYLIAKQTVEHILGIDKKQKEEQYKKENTR